MTKIIPLTQEKHETNRDYAVRILASMFQEVYAHTGREMPEEMFDRCSDLVTVIIDAVADENRERW